MPRTIALLLLLSLFFSFVPAIVHADSLDEDFYRHVRTTDSRLHRLLRRGVNVSTTFRALVERLRHSDVVVYLECDGRTHDGGRLTFVSSVAGRRYVRVRVARIMSVERQIAIIGHELRHAVEIADAPDVIDASSMAKAYERIGYPNRAARLSGLAYDSTAAVQAGNQVLREMVGVVELGWSAGY